MNNQALDDVFKPGGLLSRVIEGYEYREGQVRLAARIDEAIVDHGRLIAEAPTGIGKTGAYGVPLLLRGVPAIIATATITLQEQLLGKDLPLLDRALGKKTGTMLVKGRWNYVCQRKLTRKPPPEGPITEWIKSTATGDKREIDFKYHEWPAISSMSWECRGSSCTYAQGCYCNAARKGIDTVPIIVTNYSYLLVSGISRPLLIGDEAHEIPRIAREVLGWTLSPNSVRSVTEWLHSSTDKYWRTTAGLIEEAVHALFTQIAKAIREKDKVVIHPGDEPICSPEKVLRVLNLLGSTGEMAERHALSLLAKASEGSLITGHRAADDAKRASAAAKRLSGILHMAFVNPPEDWAIWVEQSFDDSGSSSIRVEGHPLDVSDHCSSLYSKAAVFTSATLRTTMGFDLYRSETGAPEAALEMAVQSPFPHRQLATIVVPRTMPIIPKRSSDYSSAEYYTAVAKHLEELVRYCGGRTLALFTSKASMNVSVEYLRSRGVIVAAQGDASPQDVVEQLRSWRCHVVCGVQSFWQGVDVKGPALSAVFIDRLPFDPDTPISEGLKALIARRKGDSFHEFTLPMASLKLRQGTGRLVRSKADTGVIVIADRRIVERPYGRRLIRCLPPYHVVDGLDKLASAMYNVADDGRQGTGAQEVAWSDADRPR